jgi:hypothetical protein
MGVRNPEVQEPNMRNLHHHWQVVPKRLMLQLEILEDHVATIKCATIALDAILDVLCKHPFELLLKEPS